MSYAKYPRVDLELVPSRWLLGGIGVCHLLALGVLPFIVGELLIRIALAVLIAVSLTDGLLRYGCPRHSRYIERIYCAVGLWGFYSANGKEHSAVLLSSYVHSHLLILVFATGRFTRRALVIPADAADPDQHRRLRMLLRTSDAGQESSGRPMKRGMA